MRGAGVRGRWEAGGGGRSAAPRQRLAAIAAYSSIFSPTFWATFCFASFCAPARHGERGVRRKRRQAGGGDRRWGRGQQTTLAPDAQRSYHGRASLATAATGAAPREQQHPGYKETSGPPFVPRGRGSRHARTDSKAF